MFIGSSSRHVEVAHALKRLLGDEFVTQVWDEDDVFKLGSATIEHLENHVKHYDFGIFVMLPDDELRRGDRNCMVPRDNVVFKAGLITGKLSRSRVLILTTDDDRVSLPSDLKGLTTLRVIEDAALPASLQAAASKAAGHMKC